MSSASSSSHIQSIVEITARIKDSGVCKNAVKIKEFAYEQ